MPGQRRSKDLERALTDVLRCYRQGQNAWHSLFTGRRIDRIVFAATKADHLHHTNHDRLEAILQLIAKKSIQRASFSGAEVRAFCARQRPRHERDREAVWQRDLRLALPGAPVRGERLGSRVFNGNEQFAIFPGDLPEDPARALTPEWLDAGAGSAHFVRFRPQKQIGLEFGQSAVNPEQERERAGDQDIGRGNSAIQGDQFGRRKNQQQHSLDQA